MPAPATHTTRYRATFAPAPETRARRAAADGMDPAMMDPAMAGPDVATDPALVMAPASWNPETREIDVVLSTGAAVRRYDWWNDREYIEVIPVEAADLSRINASAPWLRVHNTYSLDSVLGVIVPDSARIEGDSIVARVRLSDTPGDAEIVRKIATGLIRGVSIGYDTRAETITVADGIETRTATDWIPFEGSSVPIGADAGATVRARTAPRLESEAMTIAANPNAAAPAVATPTEAEITARATGAERERVKAIRQAGKAMAINDTAVEAMIDEGITADAARARVFELASQRDSARRVAPALRGIEVGDAEQDKRRRGLENALMHRAQPGREKLTDEGRVFMGRSLLEIGRMAIEADGVRTDGLTPRDLAGKILQRGGGGFLGTSDFPSLLANLPRKILRRAYEEAPSTYRAWSNQATLLDFRKKYAVQLGAAPNLEKIPESGEFKRGSIVDGAESYGLETYGKIIAVTRKALINDDLGALTRLPAAMARAAARLENIIMYQLLTDNGNMADGKAIFHADHANIVASGAGATVAQFAAMRSLFTKQTDLDGTTRLNLTMGITLVPDALYTSFEQFLKGQLYPATSADVVPAYARNMLLVTDPLLDDVSDKQWYGFADPATTDGFEFAYLEGEAGPVIDTEIDFNTDGMLLRVRHDFGGGCIDYRGMARNAGQ